MPGLGTSFGRGGATTFQQDLQNADCILIQGSSMAEAHPVGFRFVMKAKERGATVIHVDPRFSRTSALADRHVPIRAGSDIAFLGGLIRRVIETGGYFHDYVVHYTNAPMLIDERFQDTEDLDGVFSDPETWAYDAVGASDVTLQDPRTVFQIVRRHFQRYTPEMVSKVCGVSEEDFLAVADALIANSGRERTSVICYAVGWTQHTVGVQVIRAAAILQLLLGNIGRPGGGIMALRGHASIQGSTDIPTLYDLLPGYLPMPRVPDRASFGDYLMSAPWPADFDAYVVSLLKAWFGDAATAENNYGFDALPKLTGNHSHFVTTLRAVDGDLDGMFVMGQNPAVGSQHASLQRQALARLKWLVVRDLTEIETATFWRDDPEGIATEVFLMPAASHVEKAGTFTNTQRLLQWRDKAVEPPGQARSELWFMHQLALRLRARYAKSDDPRDWGIRNLTWTYGGDEPDADDILREINGVDLTTGATLDGYHQLKADGSTACGCWIYSGVMKGGENHGRRRDADQWGWAWPANRRMLYNRASADPYGQPWSERKRYVWWDEVAQQWTGDDVPDLDHFSGDVPFGLRADGRGWLFAPSGVVDGPLPTHYEPIESPVPNFLYPDQQSSPTRAPLGPARQPDARHGGPPLPDRGDDIPVDRAPHRRRNEPHPALAGRAPARAVRRNGPAARRRSRDHRRRLGHGEHRAG